MTSVFGGEQTIPQQQLTTQGFNTTSNQNQTGGQAYSANQLAVGLGTNAFNLANTIYGTPSIGSVPGLQVAGLTPGQQAGIDTLSNYGMNVFGTGLLPFGSEYLRSGADTILGGTNFVNQGAGVMAGAANPITGGDVNSFLNPFQDYVTQNLQNIFGQQNLANRIGGTAAAGGTGADRSAVGASLLAKQQGLAAGQTYADIYNRALQAAQQQKAQQLQAGQGLVGAGSQYGALGAQRAALGLPTIQNAFGNMQMGLQAASIPQAQQQAVNQALYQQQLGQYQDPFLRLSAQIGAIPSVAGLAGTGVSTGAQSIAASGNQLGTGQASTTYPAPPILPQIAGLGLGIGSLFASDKRAKTDIQKFGKKDKQTGLQPYAFRYKGDPKHYPKVVSYMAQDVKKKLPHAVKEFARGGKIQHFQYGGDAEEQQSQDTNYMDDFTDAGIGQGSDAPTAPYQSQGATWDLKRIFSPDRLQRAQRALALMQKTTAQAQVAKPRVSPITFPQTPWKTGAGAFGGSGYQRGGRLAIIPQAIPYIRQEGGRVDEDTAYDWGPEVHEDRPMRDRRSARPYVEQAPSWEPGQNENQARNQLFWDSMVGRAVLPRMRRISPYSTERDLRYRNLENVYRRGGFVRGYQNGGEVEAPPMGALSSPMPHATGPGGITPIPGADIPLPAARPAAAGLGETPAIPPPAPPPAGGGGGFLGGLFGGGGGGAGGGSPAMALMAAGLGMLAASGQRDARGLPMSPLGAIGMGGMQGVNVFQQQQEAARKERLAQAERSLGWARLAETQRHNQLLETRPYRLGMDPNTGEDIYIDPRTQKRVRPVEEEAPPSGVPQAPPRMTPVDPNAPSAQAGTTAAGLSEDDEGDQDYLATLPAERRAYLQKINRGELPLPPRSRQTVPILNQLARAYPGYDATVWKSRNETRAAFAKGVEGRSVTSLGTVAGHLHDYMETSQKLAKSNVKSWNRLENVVKDQFGGEALADFRVTRTALADELARVFQGAGATAESEKDRWLEALDDAKTPEQMRRVIGRLTSLIQGRMDALAQTYDRGMNYKPDSPKSRINIGWLEGKPKEKFNSVKKWGAVGGSPLEEKPAKGALSATDQQALDWANANPNDPRAAAIKKKLGVP